MDGRRKDVPVPRQKKGRKIRQPGVCRNDVELPVEQEPLLRGRPRPTQNRDPNRLMVKGEVRGLVWETLQRVRDQLGVSMGNVLNILIMPYHKPVIKSIKSGIKTVDVNATVSIDPDDYPFLRKRSTQNDSNDQ